MADSVSHLPMRPAMTQIMRTCIDYGNDPEFVESAEQTGGFEVWSTNRLSFVYDRLASAAGNDEFFPDWSQDYREFMAVLDIEGQSAARNWMRRHYRVTKLEWQPGGWSQRVLYLPVGSLLAETIKPGPKVRIRKRRHSPIRFTEPS